MKSPAKKKGRLSKELTEGPVTRACGTCTVCCNLLEVVTLKKPFGEACPKCVQDQGCSIYEVRPQICRTWTCVWSRGYGEEADRPDISGILVDVRKGPRDMAAYAIETTTDCLGAIDALERISRDAGVPVYLVDMNMQEVELSEVE